MAEGRGLFRPKALDRASSPESLDQLMRVVSPKDWLPLLVLGSLSILALAWSVTGRVPTAVTGRGILFHPRRILELQSAASGRIETLQLRAGDRIRKGDVVARIDQSELRRRLEDDRDQLADLQSLDRSRLAAQQEQGRLAKQQTQLQNLAADLQAESLRKTVKDAEAMAPVLERRLESLRKLQQEGLIPAVSPDLLQAEQAVRDNAAKVADAAARLKQLDLTIKQSESQEAALARETVDASAERRTRMQEVAARIAMTELQLRQSGVIVSQHTGKVFEVVASAGQVVAPGTRLATVEAEGDAQPLVSIAYFPIGDGKKIQAGMAVQVTPDTVERQRFGGIRGAVQSVSALPVTREGTTALVGNAEVVQGLMPSGAFLEVITDLEADPSTPSGYRWSSSGGPPLRITPGLTNSVRVTVESRAPITYVMPFLREITGIY